LTVLTATLAAVGCGGAASSEVDAGSGGETFTGRVSSCHDGDTCVVDRDGERVTLRFAGIDAPEVSGGPDNRGQPMGRDARDLLNDLVRGKTVKVRAIEPDPYGRTVAEVFVDTKLVNMVMVEKGMAEAYRWATNEIDKVAYRRAEERARDAERGVWSLDDYESPSDFRHRN
jgi:micrococcal nuclease